MSSDCIQSSKIHGHQGSVLCMDITEDAFVLSGSEDKTARLWDLRDSRNRACICIQALGEVLSVAFAPKLPDVGPSSPLEGGVFAKDLTVCV